MATCVSAKLATSLLPIPSPNNLRRSFLSPHHLLRSLTSSSSSTTTTTTTRVYKDGNPNLLFQALSAAQKDQISLYVRALLQWNQRMNLTAVKEEDEVMTRHIEDSLAMLPPIRRSHDACSSVASFDGLRVIDVGTGAGIPGLVLAVACPGWKVTLLESMNKRCLFLEHAVDAMGLSNVQILCGRAENVGHELEFREAFDVAMARAVAEMRVLVEYCLPFVRIGGLFVAAKGHDPQVEVKTAEHAIQLLGASMIDLCTVDSHSPYGKRTAIICRKDRPTPAKYPRQPGLPAKMPL